MKNIYFVTTNKTKVESAVRSLGDQFRIIQYNLEIREEGYDIIKISADKARIGYSRLHNPVISDDSAFIIPSLNGYPGARVGRELKSQGLEHFKKLAKEAKGELEGYFSMAVTYFDGKEKPKSFVSNIYGNLISEERGNRETKCDIGKIFVLKDHTKTLAEMTKDEYNTHATSDRWEKLKRYILEKV